MASGKRASMREGPLAALFRRTEEEGTEPGGEDRPAGREGEDTQERRVGAPVIRVVGVGGAGVNAVNRMVEAQIEGVEFIGVNTDLQSLQQCAAHVTLHIGAEVTRGLGSGSNPELGRQSAMDEYDKIKA